MRFKRHKNNVCLICDYVINRNGEPYCKIRKQFTEKLPEIKSLSDCPQRTTWVDRLPDELPDFKITTA